MQYIYLVFLLAACSMAWLCGKRTEHWGAAVILVGSLLSPVVQLSAPFKSFDLPLFLLDLTVLALFFAIALRSDRFWPMWSAAFHLIATTTHLARLVNPTILPEAYAHAQAFWAYPMLTAMVIGALTESRSRTASDF